MPVSREQLAVARTRSRSRSRPTSSRDCRSAQNPLSPGMGKPRRNAVELEFVPVFLVRREMVQYLFPNPTCMLRRRQQTIVFGAYTVEAVVTGGVVEDPCFYRKQSVSPDRTGFTMMAAARSSPSADTVSSRGLTLGGMQCSQVLIHGHDKKKRMW